MQNGHVVSYRRHDDLRDCSTSLAQNFNNCTIACISTSCSLMLANFIKIPNMALSQLSAEEECAKRRDNEKVERNKP